MIKKIKKWFRAQFSKKATIGSWLKTGAELALVIVGAIVVTKWAKGQTVDRVSMPKLTFMTVLKNRKSA